MTWVVGLISPIAPCQGEPEVAIRAHRDPPRAGRREGGVLDDGVGGRVDLTDLVAPVSVNQRLPSGPAVIPKGQALAVGSGNKEIAWVVGLIIPIALEVRSVNQRLPSGPVVIP